MLGKNFVILVGSISRPTFKNVGQYNTPLFKGSLVIPLANDRKQYIKIAAWGEIAEALKDIDPQTYIKVQGHIEESSYEGKCKHCSGVDKKYWTEVVIDAFAQATEEDLA
jgi:hypothetical protein